MGGSEGRVLPLTWGAEAFSNPKIDKMVPENDAETFLCTSERIMHVPGWAKRPLDHDTDTILSKAS